MSDKLAIEVADLSGVAEAYQGLYSQDTESGKYTLTGVDLGPLRNKVAQFRDNNVALKQANEQMTQILKPFKDAQVDITYEAWKKGQDALATLENLPADRKPDPKAIEAEVERRIQSVRQQHTTALTAKDEALKALNDKHKAMTGELERFLVERDITAAAATVAKIRDGAHADVMRRAQEVWRRDDQGRLVAIGNDGGQIFHDGNPITPQQWVKNLVNEAGHLFVEGKAGGSTGGTPGGNSPMRWIDDNDPVALGRAAKDIKEGKVGVRSTFGR